MLDNPGTLAEGMDASAGLTAADGTPIYPYQNGKLEYYESTKITAKATGPVERVSLLNYGDVKAGQLLVQLGAKDTDEEIASKENALKAAQEKLEEATKELEKYNAVAPIDGTVLQCSLTEGQEVSSGQGITIADTSQMIIEIQVDERNARYIKAGMMVDINQYGTPYVGIVESVSMTASGENGVASIPAVVTVDNYDGSMIPGTYAEYSFVASESEDCLTVPVQAVKYVSFANVQLPENLDADPSAGMDDGMMDDGMMDDGMMDGGMVDDGMMDGGMVDGGVEALPQSYSGGAFADPLGMVAVPMPGGGGVVDGGSMSSGGASDDSTGVIVWVKSKEAPANAILEPDPTWDCPEGFWAVPVEVGLSDNSRWKSPAAWRKARRSLSATRTPTKCTIKEGPGMLIDVKTSLKSTTRGGERGSRTGRRLPLRGPGRIPGHHRPVRLRQVHPHEYPGLPGHPHLRGLPPGRRGRHRAVRPAARPHPQQTDRLHLPGLQPHPRPQRLGECGAAPHLPGRARLQAGRPGGGRPGAGGSGRARRAQAHRDVRRPAAARGHRPRHRHPAPIIMADEPTGALDSRTGKHVLEILHGLHDDGSTIIPHHPRQRHRRHRRARRAHLRRAYHLRRRQRGAFL